MGNFAPAIGTMHPGKETTWMEMAFEVINQQNTNDKDNCGRRLCAYGKSGETGRREAI